MKIVCDVDITVVRSDWAWFNHIMTMCTTFHKDLWEQDNRLGQISYSYDKYFDIPPEKDIQDFWSSCNYQGMCPTENSIDVLKRSNIPYCFASGITGETYQSKKQFLKEYFSYAGHYRGFIGTHEKWNVVCPDDIMIDDRVQFFEDHDGSLLPSHNILLDLGYEQDKPVDKSIIVCKDWLQVEQVIKGIKLCSN